MFHVDTRRRLVRRIPAEGLDPCGYGVDVFLFATRHLIVVCTQTYIFRCCILFEAVVCRLYEMLYPCICNVVISCWKSGAYGFVICRGGTDMCFVLRFGRKRPDLKQYRISDPVMTTSSPILTTTLSIMTTTPPIMTTTSP